MADNSGIGAAVGFGLLSAGTWGAGDFCGGLAGKRAPIYSVIISTQVVGMLFLIICALLFQDKIPPLAHVLGGVVMGIVGTVGLFALYYSLAHGKMSVTAPVSGVVATVLPLGFAVLRQEQITLLKAIGFLFALIAVWFVSRTDGGAIQFRDLGLPIVAGIGFGLFYIVGKSATEVSNFWPLVVARVTSVTGFLIFVTLRRQQRFVPRKLIGITSLGGMLDAGGNAFYVLSAQAGNLISIAAVLSSLYPAMTVLLARFILNERLGRTQLIGVVAALVAIVLISV